MHAEEARLFSQEDIGRIGRTEQDIGRIGRAEQDIGRIGRSLIEACPCLCACAAGLPYALGADGWKGMLRACKLTGAWKHASSQVRAADSRRTLAASAATRRRSAALGALSRTLAASAAA
jgi:hypothetical protein